MRLEHVLVAVVLMIVVITAAVLILGDAVGPFDAFLREVLKFK